MFTVKIFFLALTGLMLSAYAFSSSCHDLHEHKGSMQKADEKASSLRSNEEKTPIRVNNKICPVSGDKIGGMGPTVEYEHEGKIYNLCCAGCLSEFKNKPQKYIDKVNEELSLNDLQNQEKKEFDSNQQQPKWHKY